MLNGTRIQHSHIEFDANPHNHQRTARRMYEGIFGTRMPSCRGILPSGTVHQRTLRGKAKRVSRQPR